MFTSKIENALNTIKSENDKNMSYILFLQEENKRLKDEAYKDEELKKMKESLDKMKKDYWRGFPITEEEQRKIDNWKEEHNKKHPTKNDFGGCSGGRYSYHFIPSGLGTSGVIRCSCGAEFEFQEIG